MICVIFDVGGTLIGAKNIFLEVAKKLGRPELCDNIKQVFWESISLNNFLTEEEALNLTIEIICKNHDLDPSLINNISREVFVDKSELFPKTNQVLETLKNNNVTMIVASDSDKEILLSELNKHNIKKYFDEIITSSIVRAYKPSDKFADAIKNVLTNYESNLELIYFVGDSDADIKIAKKVGSIPIYINRDGEKHADAVYNISSLDELYKILNIDAPSAT